MADAPGVQGDVRGIRAASTSEWLADNIEGATPPFHVELIVGGHSNLTYRVTDASGVHLVLRRPPLGAVLATAHDMSREHRIITGVGRTSVPVPRALGLCEDESVNDAPFYVMNFVEGHVLDSAAVAVRFPVRVCSRAWVLRDWRTRPAYPQRGKAERTDLLGFGSRMPRCRSSGRQRRGGRGRVSLAPGTSD